MVLRKVRNPLSYRPKRKSDEVNGESTNGDATENKIKDAEVEEVSSYTLSCVDMS